MAILTLKEAESELTLNVATAEVVEGKFGSQVKFVDDGGDVLFVPEASVTRQLDRVGVSEVEEMSGKRIHFSRSKPSGPKNTIFWNIDKAREGDVVKTNGNGKKSTESAASRIASETAAIDRALPGENEGFDVILQRYGECLSEAMAFGQRIATKLPVTGDTVSSIAATLFIERNRKNV